MIDKEAIRKQIIEMGADVCGFSAISRFERSPKGFHPKVLYADCQTVIALGIALPKGLYEVAPRLIYGHFNAKVCDQINEIAFNAAKRMESEKGVCAVPIPSDDPYEYWDEERLEGKGLMSMKHAAVNCGLGTLGKSTLLLSEQYGNRLVIGCILTNMKLPSDDLAEPVCLPECQLCVLNCPAQAIKEGHVDQKRCRTFTQNHTKRGFSTVDCNTCRSICPKRLGTE